MSASGSPARGSADWLRATILSALGSVPLGACTCQAAIPSTAAGEQALKVNATPARSAPTVPASVVSAPTVAAPPLTMPVVSAPSGEIPSSTRLRGYRFCNSHVPLKGTPGWFECDSGLKHRAKAVTCRSELPRKPPKLTADYGECVSDADCDESPNGYCDPEFPSSDERSCNYGCTVDADCEPDQLCFCGSPVGRCVEADCHVDADCGGRALCGIHEHKTPYQIDTFGIACQVPAYDQCGGGKDCGPGEMCVNAEDPGIFGTSDIRSEKLAEVGARVCIRSELPEGRPFLIGGNARTAKVSQGADWQRASGCKSEAFGSAELDAAERQVLHVAWLRRALQEHASIAAFSRFALQLLQLGAPAQLLLETQRATLDEINHARSCFALASRFAGCSLGPGALDVTGVTLDESLAAMVQSTILEGCVGETLAALEAAEAARYARDGEVKAALEQIAGDEARHAALAWRFVAWVLARDGDTIRTLVSKTFDTLLFATTECSRPAALVLAESSVFTEHGVLPESYRQALSAQGLRDVIAPCVLELLRWRDRLLPSAAPIDVASAAFTVAASASEQGQTSRPVHEDRSESA
jgi:hypothetical protein